MQGKKCRKIPICLRVAGSVQMYSVVPKISLGTIFACSSFKTTSGGSRISGKGVHMFKGVGVRFADFLFIFLKYPLK